MLNGLAPACARVRRLASTIRTPKPATNSRTDPEPGEGPACAAAQTVRFPLRMSTLIFVLVWVALGLGLLLIALSGGPGGALQRLMSQSRRGRKAAVVAFGLALVVLGIGVPVAVVSAVNSNRDNIPEADVAALTEAEKRGRELFGDRCANCHTLEAANAVAQVGPNLDQLRPPKALVLDAIENGRARGNGQMAADLYEGQDADDVASFVAKAVGQEGEAPGGEGSESGGEGSESGG
jgi:mono/diheme cytochrome c family protein